MKTVKAVYSYLHLCWYFFVSFPTCLLVVVGCLYVNVGSESHLERERRLKQAVVAETIGTLVAVKLCIHPGVERYVTEYWGSKERSLIA